LLVQRPGEEVITATRNEAVRFLEPRRRALPSVLGVLEKGLLVRGLIELGLNALPGEHQLHVERVGFEILRYHVNHTAAGVLGLPQGREVAGLVRGLCQEITDDLGFVTVAESTKHLVQVTHPLRRAVVAKNVTSRSALARLGRVATRPV